MSESAEERRVRLVAIIERRFDTDWGEEVLEDLLDALEPPLADMVLRGVVEVVCEEHGAKAAWYAPRGDA